MSPEELDLLYTDFAEDTTSSYANESWYRDVMSIYSSQKESESF